MEPQILHALELTAAIFGQTVLLASAWGFLCALFTQSPRILPDSLADFMFSKQVGMTWTFTLLATILSVATTTFLSIAFKEALRHRMHKPISLVQLSSAIALARGSFLINFRHPIPALATLAVFGVTKLLVSSWATLLTPTLVTRSVDASGWELDLTSGSFEQTLQQDLVQSGAALVRGNSTEIFDLDGVLSGIAAAQYSFGAPGLFDFNGVQYNVSTGGVLPAVPEYSGTTDLVSNNNTGLGFAGGQVPTHLHVNFPGGLEQRGLQHSFTLVQQGLTADVTCQRTNSMTENPNYSSSFNAIPVPLANGTTDYWLWAWNITADCSAGPPAQQQYVTRSNSSTLPQGSSTGFLSFLVCPYPLGQSGVSWEQFTVITNATWRFSFLPQTTCTITPLVTTSRVDYSNNIINTTVISSRALDGSNSNLSLFLAAIVNHQSLTTQSLTTNAIGDALYAIYISALDDSITSNEAVTDLLLRELEQFWRGVIEFSETFLRSAFSVSPHGIPPESRISVSGDEVITTMGWYYRSAYVILPITVVALMVYTAVAYALWHVFVERGHESFTVFDPSNPVHLMMVSSTRDLHDPKDNLGDRVAGFERGGVGKNENLMVQLMNVGPGSHRKRFGVIPQARDPGRSK